MVTLPKFFACRLQTGHSVSTALGVAMIILGRCRVRLVTKYLLDLLLVNVVLRLHGRRSMTTGVKLEPLMLMASTTHNVSQSVFLRPTSGRRSDDG